MSRPRRPWIVPVGGFLGAGKTTLIFAAARHLRQMGVRVAVVMNDQGQDLVDSRSAAQRGLPWGEVTNGCFCCRFSQLIEALAALRAYEPDIIFIEPVGSCTDIVATVIAPLRAEFSAYQVAPFTVLVDPVRYKAAQAAGDGSDNSFLFNHQIEEADLICITKSDLYADVDLPGIVARRVSAMTGQGVTEWVDEILSGRISVAQHTLNIDYARYASAEAALTWLNLSFHFEPSSPASPAFVIGPFLDRLDNELTGAGVDIAHLKMIDTASSGWLKTALCGNGQMPHLEGDLDASAALHHELVLNLRAEGDPSTVEAIVHEALSQLDGVASDVKLQCFSPAPPRPERRIEVL